MMWMNDMMMTAQITALALAIFALAGAVVETRIATVRIQGEKRRGS